MKISIIVPVYNEAEMIKGCLKSLIEQDYSKKDYEIIVINDGSTDKTLENVESIIKKNKKTKIRLINQKNSGRAISREVGAKSAKYENLILTDSRCLARNDLLKKAKELDYAAVVGNPLMNDSTFTGRFGLLFRIKLYKGSFEKFEPVYLTPQNFDDINKGTTIVFIKKKLFLSSQLDNQESKNNSDDTKLLWNIVQKKDILKSPDLVVTYNPRSSLTQHIRHTYNRGPKFVDYYFKPGRKYFPYILALLFLSLLALLFLIFNPVYLIYLIALTFLGLILVSVWLSRRISDFFVVFVMLPITFISFSLGIFKGILLKILRRY